MKIQSGKVFFFSLQSVIAMFTILTCLSHGVGCLLASKFWIFQLIILWGTGYIIQNFFFKATTWNENLLLAYPIGIVVVMIEYFLLVPLGLKDYMPLVAVVHGLIVIVGLIRLHPAEERQEVIKNWPIIIAFLFVWLLFGLFTVSFVNTLPSESGGTDYFVDWPFWVGNNISFTKGFPVENFRQVGAPFRYHYFSSIVIAQISLMTGIDVVVLSFYFSFILAAILLVGASFFLLTLVTEQTLLITIGMIGLLFTDGTTVTLAWHNLICPFGFDYAYAYELFSIAIIKRIADGDRSKATWFLSTLFLVMCVGNKGPVGVVVLSGFGILALILLCHKEIRVAFMYGGSWLAAFICTFFAFIYDKWCVESEAGLKYVGLRGAIRENYFVYSLKNGLMNAIGIGDSKLLSLYSLWLDVFRTNKFALVMLTIAGIMLLLLLIRKKYYPFILIAVIVSIFGYYLGVATVQSGGSQMYFCMAAVPFSIIAGVYIIEIYRGYKQYVYAPLIALACIFLGVSSELCVETLLFKSSEGIACIRGKQTQNSYTTDHYMDELDYDTCLWIRDNTDSGAVIAIDSWEGSYGLNREMMAGVFSERFVFNEMKYTWNSEEAFRRNSLVQEFFLSQNTGNALIDEGVDYVIRTNEITKCNFGTALKDKIVYSNSRYTVYRLK
ncbi:hypothetical protein SAMN02910301_0433 [Lachnospiraceae bacterium XBD2001]|nr:hypothetical protein SAMN02910301_0433 [Lachnospiraceae bacterium XBD2001]